MGPKRAMGSTALPGDSTLTPGTAMRMPTSRSVAMSVVASLETSSFTFCRMGLGLRAGATLAAVWNAW